MANADKRSGVVSPPRLALTAAIDQVDRLLQKEGYLDGRTERLLTQAFIATKTSPAQYAGVMDVIDTVHQGRVYDRQMQAALYSAGAEAARDGTPDKMILANTAVERRGGIGGATTPSQQLQ